jgi:hypothetical protein
MSGRFIPRLRKGSNPFMLGVGNNKMRWPYGLSCRDATSHLYIIVYASDINISWVLNASSGQKGLKGDKQSSNLRGSYKAQCLKVIASQMYKAKHLWSR